MEASLSKEEMLLYEKNWDRISSEKTLLSAARDNGQLIGLYKSVLAMLRNNLGIDPTANILQIPRSKVADLNKLPDQYGDSAEDHLE